MRHLRLIVILAGRHLLELSRMPGILAVIFVPGIVLYAVFTLVLPVGGGGRSLPQIKLAVVDQDGTVASRALIAALGNMSIQLETADGAGHPLDEAGARYRVEKEHVSAAVVIPSGYTTHLYEQGADEGGVILVINEAQPMAGDIVAGMLQMAAGMAMFDMVGDLLAQLTGRRLIGPDLSAIAPDASAAAVGTEPPAPPRELLRVRTQGVAVKAHQGLPPPSMLYLAGLVPMFLLFNASGSAGALLTEIRAGGTRRIMVAPVSAADYLFGFMGSAMVLSLLQCLAMYAFAGLVFGAPVVDYAGGLTALTVATCLATVGFGTLLGGVARSAEQLNSMGMVVILGMSAIGGSMVPRFFMPDWVKPLGLFTLNGWAYDGFLDVATGQGIAESFPEIAVLAGIGLVSAGLGAVLLGRRLRLGAEA